MKTPKILNTYFEFLQTELKDIDQHLSKIVDKDLRGKIFAIEGIIRLQLDNYLDHFSKSEIKYLTKIFEDTKEMEDALGKFALLGELIEFHAKTSFSHDKEVMAKIKTDQAAASLKIIKKLFKYRKQTFKHQKLIKKIRFPKHTKRFIRTSIKLEIKSLRKKIKNELAPIINKKKYSYRELEDGLHEFRRNIRWISIYIQGYKSIFSFETLPENLTKSEQSLVNQYKNNRFAHLNHDPELILVDPIKYYQLSDYIFRIGEIKTNGELRHFLEQDYNSKPKKNYPVEKKAQVVLNQFLKDDPLKDLIL